MKSSGPSPDATSKNPPSTPKPVLLALWCVFTASCLCWSWHSSCSVWIAHCLLGFIQPEFKVASRVNKECLAEWMNGWMVSAPTLPLGQASMTSPITLIFKKAQICLQHEVYLFPMNSLPLGLLWFPPVCELWLILVTGTEYRKHVVFKECLVDARGDNPTIIRPLLPVNGMFRELLRAQGPTGQTSSGWCY